MIIWIKLYNNLNKKFYLNYKMPLKITNSVDIIILKDKFCVPLELKINKISKSNDWVAIGDHLYYFIYPDTNHIKPPNTLTVKNEYFSILKDIIQKNNFN